MAEVDFDEFVRARSGRLLRIAYALTRDHTRAEDLLQTALARCWGAWRRIDGDPEPYVRRSLVNTYNSWWQRRWRDELPSETVPDRPQEPAQHRIDDRDGVWQALGRLPRRQRAVLVLRYYEDMTEAQVAELLGVTVGTVKSTAAKGLARLRTDEGLREFRTPEVPAGQERVAAVHERIEARRRSRLAVTGAAVAVVLALILGYAFAAHRRNDHPVTPAPSPSGSLSFAYPEWDEGEHVVASASKSMTTDGVIVTAPGGDRELRVRFTCHTRTRELAGRIQARLVVTSPDRFNGIHSTDITCGVDDTVGRNLGLRPAADRLEWDETVRFPHGMTVGMTFTLDGHPLGAEQLPEAVAAWAAVVEVVPFESFVFPPRSGTSDSTDH